MDVVKLYKYLDSKGGLKMLYYRNLQFTNAARFNDPFDCHPALFDYSNVPATKNNWPPADFLQSKGENDMINLRNRTWICCLSKVHDSLLMWSYYNSHKGICVGLNVEKVLQCCQDMFVGTVPPYAEEVKYKEILPKIDYFKDHPMWNDLLATKAKEWEHEKEVRLITQSPGWLNEVRTIPEELKNEESVDVKEIRYYPSLSADCFESVYLGVNILHADREKIVKTARKINPKIKIFQMKLDLEAFQLNEELLES